MRTAILLLLSTLVFVPAVASAQGGPATRYIRAQNQQLDHILTQPASPARDAQVTTMLVDLLDFDELCRRALDTHWDALTPAQRTDFSSLLRQLVERNYRTNMERIRDYDVDYTREETTATGVVVHTTARSRASRREPPVELNYTMHMVGSDWRVIDVTTEGVSMVHNYQQQFHRIITRDGFDALLTRMRERLAGSATPATTGAH